MKKISPITLIRFCAIVFLSLFLNPSVVKAQVVGGGGGQSTNNTPASNSILDEDDFYQSFNIGFILPEGTFGQEATFPSGSSFIFKDLAMPFQGLTGLGATTGYTFNYTMFASLSKLQMSPTMPARFGLQVGFDFGFIPTSWSNFDWSTYNMTVTTNPFLYTGLKIGPQFNINPMPGMGIGFYLTLDPYLTIPGGENATYNYTDASGDNYNITYDISDTSSIHFNIDVSAGINFYYKALMIGIEYNWVHSKYNGAGKEEETYTTSSSVSTASAYYPFTDVISMDMLKFTIGLRFGTRVRH